jgi:hypothetical protein
MLSQGMEVNFFLLELRGKTVQASADMDNLPSGDRPLDKTVSFILAFRKQSGHILAGKIAINGIFKDFFGQLIHIILHILSITDSMWKIYAIFGYIANSILQSPTAFPPTGKMRI